MTETTITKPSDTEVVMERVVSAPRPLVWETYADPKHPPFCGDARAGRRFYCHPLKYDPLPNTLYRNDGRGQFTDVSAESGVGALRSNGLGVVIADYDEDG